MLGKITLAVMFMLLMITAVNAGEISGHYTMTSDSVRIYYETQGEGIPILMIAGGPGGNPDFFKETHKLWLAYGKLVYVNNRGRGHSQMLDSVLAAYSPYNDVLDIEAVRKDLGVDKVIVYGHSYGSMATLLYAVTYPEHCLAIMTTGALAGEKTFQKYNIDGVKYFLERCFPDNWDQIKALHDSGVPTSDERYENVWPGLKELYYYYPENDKVMRDIWDSRDTSVVGFNYNVYTGIVGDDPEWTINGTLKGLELTPMLSRVNFPALIMGGRYDRICPPVVQREIAGAIPGGEIVIFDKSGHRPFIEEPMLYFETTGEFLRKVLGK